jgi:RNA polymerase sigma factor (sigma-70 family)
MPQPQSDSSDTALLEALRRGDASVWPVFFDRYDRLIRGIVGWHKWRFDSQLQEDMAQVARLEITKAIGSVADASKLAAFVKSTCVHRCIDEVRRQVRARQVMVSSYLQDVDDQRVEETVPAGESFDPIREIVRSEEAAELGRALDGIGDTCAAAIREFYCEGLSYREMAEKHGIAVNTVGSRLAKCLERLREMMGA